MGNTEKNRKKKLAKTENSGSNETGNFARKWNQNDEHETYGNPNLNFYFHSFTTLVKYIIKVNIFTSRLRKSTISNFFSGNSNDYRGGEIRYRLATLVSEKLVLGNARRTD